MKFALIQPNLSDFDELSRATGLECLDESKTHQSFAKDADINTIVERFGLTGEMPDDFRAPQYGDFDEAVDYQSAMNILRASGESFMTLPAVVRERFDNNPQKLMEFLDDPSNRQQAEKLGLVPPQPVSRSEPPAPSAPPPTESDVPVGKPDDFSRGKP